MDIRKIKKLIELMIESDLQSLEVKEGDDSVALTRSKPNVITTTPTHYPPFETPVAKDSNAVVENSPMVGVFYCAPSPNDAPYVRAGQAVQAGDTLGIIEAMKIMNPLEATHSGVIEEILVKNGDVVQFGQPIIRYKP